MAMAFFSIIASKTANVVVTAVEQYTGTFPHADVVLLIDVLLS
jgi:hypothetical protein